MEWLYEHTSGNISVVVSLIHDAQEIAILNGTEVLNLESLNEAYQQRLSMLHGFIQPTIPQRKQTSTPKKKSAQISPSTTKITDTDVSTANLVFQAKSANVDIVQLLKAHMPVVEVVI